LASPCHLRIAYSCFLLRQVLKTRNDAARGPASLTNFVISLNDPASWFNLCFRLAVVLIGPFHGPVETLSPTQDRLHWQLRRCLTRLMSQYAKAGRESDLSPLPWSKLLQTTRQVSRRASSHWSISAHNCRMVLEEHSTGHRQYRYGIDALSLVK